MKYILLSTRPRVCDLGWQNALILRRQSGNSAPHIGSDTFLFLFVFYLKKKMCENLNNGVGVHD